MAVEISSVKLLQFQLYICISFWYVFTGEGQLQTLYGPQTTDLLLSLEFQLQQQII